MFIQLAYITSTDLRVLEIYAYKQVLMRCVVCVFLGNCKGWFAGLLTGSLTVSLAIIIMIDVSEQICETKLKK